MNKTSAKFLLVAVFAARGVSFIFSKGLMNEMDPMCILAIRFLMAFGILAIIFHKKIRQCTKASLKGGVILGILYTVCMIFEMYGLRLIDSGVSSLIENMAIVMVPIYVAVITKVLPNKMTIFCAVLAIVGVGFLSISQTGGNSSLGVFLAILAALTYAMCVLATHYVSQDGDPITIGMIQLGIMGAISFFISLGTGNLALPGTGMDWGMLLILVLLCSCFGFTFQPVGQKYMSAEAAAVFTIIQPLTSSIAGIVAGEGLGYKKLIGYILVLSALLIYNLKDTGMLKKEKGH